MQTTTVRLYPTSIWEYNSTRTKYGANRKERSPVYLSVLAVCLAVYPCVSLLPVGGGASGGAAPSVRRDPAVLQCCTGTGSRCRTTVAVRRRKTAAITHHRPPHSMSPALSGTIHFYFLFITSYQAMFCELKRRPPPLPPPRPCPAVAYPPATPARSP